jgi:hypothetical protein
MSLDQWRAMSDDELIDLAHTLTPGHTDDVAVARIRRARSAKREAESGAALVKATGRLVSTTSRLGRATWVLGGVTLLLVVVAAIPAYPLLRREDTGRRIRRECEAIMREAAAVAVEAGRGSLAQGLERDGVLNCLVESAKARP